MAAKKKQQRDLYRFVSEVSVGSERYAYTKSVNKTNLAGSTLELTKYNPKTRTRMKFVMKSKKVSK